MNKALLTSGSLLLLRRPLPSLFHHPYMLQTILLIIIPRIQLLVKMPERLSQIFDRGYAARVIGGDCGAAQALAEDAVAGA